MDGWTVGQTDGWIDMGNSYRISGAKYGVNKLLGMPRHRLEYSI
jgi:hypothetical protein